MRALVRQFLDPKASRRMRWTGSFVIAVTATFAIRSIDEGVARRNNREYGAIIARQIASQAEGLALAAGQKNITDPVGWALFYLGQGVEPRYISVTREKGAIGDGVGTNRKGEVEVRKTLAIPGKDDSGSIRVAVSLPAIGFLGTTSPITRDLTSVAFAAVLMLLIGLMLQRRTDRHIQQSLSERQARIAELVPEFKTVLLGIGQRMRDIFTHFERLSESSREAQDNVRHARLNFHQTIQVARGILKRADEVAGCTLHAEASVLNLMVEAGKAAHTGAPSSFSVRLVHQQLLEIRSRAAALQREIRQLEQGLEPMTTDLDLGFHALNDAQDSLRAIPVEIRKTSEQMTEQGRIFQKLRETMTG